MVDSPSIHEQELTSDLPAEVELRIKRLEAAVAALQDTPLMEERVAERVIQRLKKTPIKALRDSAEALLEPNGKAPKPDDAIAVSPVTDTTQPKAKVDKRGWFLFDFWTEVRSIGRMFFDHRYHFSWIGRIAPTVILTMYIFLWLFVPSALSLVERIADIALIVLLYHILAREARLYRSTYP